MKSFKLPATLLIGFSLILSCNSGDTEKKSEEKITDSSQLKSTETTQENKAAPANSGQLTNVIIIKHKVAGYTKWKTGYDSHDSARAASGLSNYLIGRGTPDSNTVLVILRATDTAKAKEFTKLPDLKEAMKKAGVIGQPAITLVDVAWNNPAGVDQSQHLMVTHKVKDFETWRKEFEADRQARVDAGLIDLGFGYSSGDNHMVTVVFAVNDLAKAKAILVSKDLKEKMSKAGVEGTPAFFFYKVTESY
ncbi:MAG TPA: hypothetical protein VFI06_05290 [Chitinophagaceae bacterium]|nr:hypothetical protein [Chitinophagaceae bacterium]